MERSAGILFIYDGKMLLAHSRSSKWYGTFMPPKGAIEDYETKEEAACRETEEEIGISVNPADLGQMHTIRYVKGKRVYKEVYVFEYHTKCLKDIGLEEEEIAKENLQLDEVDFAKFMDKEEAKIRIFHRYEQLLNLI
jgi:8-oxo-dGTP pyrophosphatase MutT (NUDIX family)